MKSAADSILSPISQDAAAGSSAGNPLCPENDSQVNLEADKIISDTQESSGVSRSAYQESPEVSTGGRNIYANMSSTPISIVANPHGPQTDPFPDVALTHNTTPVPTRDRLSKSRQFSIDLFTRSGVNDLFSYPLASQNSGHAASLLSSGNPNGRADFSYASNGDSGPAVSRPNTHRSPGFVNPFCQMNNGDSGSAVSRPNTHRSPGCCNPLEDLTSLNIIRRSFF